jgi:hypothetical protein
MIELYWLYLIRVHEAHTIWYLIYSHYFTSHWIIYTISLMQDYNLHFKLIIFKHFAQFHRCPRRYVKIDNRGQDNTTGRSEH